MAGQWKHGWIPLTPGAVLSKNHGRKPGGGSKLGKQMAGMKKKGSSGGGKAPDASTPAGRSAIMRGIREREDELSARARGAAAKAGFTGPPKRKKPHHKSALTRGSGGRREGITITPPGQRKPGVPTVDERIEERNRISRMVDADARRQLEDPDYGRLSAAYTTEKAARAAAYEAMQALRSAEGKGLRRPESSKVIERRRKKAEEAMAALNKARRELNDAKARMARKGR